MKKWSNQNILTTLVFRVLKTCLKFRVLSPAALVLSLPAFLAAVTVTSMVANVVAGDALGNTAYADDLFTYKQDYVQMNQAQIFEVPRTGYYWFEAWGAQGGSMMAGGHTGVGGRGGYAKGLIYANQGEKYYIYVGAQGQGWNNLTNHYGGYNGGGTAYQGASGGGGATDFRWFGTPGDPNYEPTDAELVWNSALGFRSRILVAGGGGGSNDSTNGGYGGGLVGGNGQSVNCSAIPTGATQVGGGTGWITGFWGYGSGPANANGDGGAGGGGYWGGAKGQGYNCAGSGGSGFVSGHLGAVAITEGSTSPRNSSLTGTACTSASAAKDISCSVHYSTKQLYNTVLTGGNNAMPDPLSDNNTVGHSGNGYARVTYYGDPSNDNSVRSFSLSGNPYIEPLFNSSLYGSSNVYKIFLTGDQRSVTPNLVPNDSKAVVVGAWEYTLEPGETKSFPVFVTAENGDTRTYYFEAHRSMLSSLIVTDEGPMSPTNGQSIDLTYNRNAMQYSNLDLDPEQYIVNIQVSTADANTITVTGAGEQVISAYENEFTVTLESSVLKDQDNNPLKETYTVYLYRNPSDDPEVDKILVNGREVSCQPGVDCHINVYTSETRVDVEYSYPSMYVSANGDNISNGVMVNTSDMVNPTYFRITSEAESVDDTGILVNYHLYFHHVRSTKLQSLKLSNFDVELQGPGGASFNPEITSYKVTLPSTYVDAIWDAVPATPGAIVTQLTDSGYDTGRNMTSNNAVIGLKVSLPGYYEGCELEPTPGEDCIAPTIYEINVTRQSTDIGYPTVGNYYVFEAPATDNYFFEGWGAKGGKGCHDNASGTVKNGKGGYTSGIVHLEKGEKIYVYVGGAGYDCGTTGYTCAPDMICSADRIRRRGFMTMGGWNGGGHGGQEYNELNGSGADEGGGGGGATDFRYFGNYEPTEADLVWNSERGLASRIMVAAGGAGGGRYNTANVGGHGGVNFNNNGYKFGVGERGQPEANYASGSTGSGGGGGGYWGGRSTTGTGVSNGYYNWAKNNNYYGVVPSEDIELGTGLEVAQGGTSYVSGYTPDIAINGLVAGGGIDTTWRGADDASVCLGAATDHITCSNHYSGKVFMKPVQISGAEEMPTTVKNNKGTTMTGNDASGYAWIRTLSKNYYLDTLTASKGTLSPAFDTMVTNYTLTLDPYDYYVDIEATAKDADAIVTGPGRYEVETGTKVVEIKVESPDTATRTYTITIVRPPMDDLNTLYLKKIWIDEATQMEEGEYKWEDTYTPTTLEYSIEVPARYFDLTALYEKFNPNSVVEVKGDKFLSHSTGDITLKVTDPTNPSLAGQEKVYTIHYTKIGSNSETFPPITSGYKTFKAPVDGWYHIQAWGAQGGYNASRTSRGGKGAYTEGDLYLNEGETIYIYTGAQPTNYAQIQGAGSVGISDSGRYGYAGGAASDVRFFPNLPQSTQLNWSNADGLRARIMVAAGGGGAVSNVSYLSDGGYGGALVGGEGSQSHTTGGYPNTTAKGGTQVAGGSASGIEHNDFYETNGGRGTDGSFGVGGSANYWGSGGGGGWYGGGGGGYSHNTVTSAAGGSSYISGYTGSIAVGSSSATGARLDSFGNECLVGTLDPLCSESWNGKKFRNPIMIAGNAEMPTQDGTGTQIGNSGSGLVIVTYATTDAYLKDIKHSDGTLKFQDGTEVDETHPFDGVQLNYILDLDQEVTSVDIEGIAHDLTADVQGNGTVNILPGETKVVTMTVTSGLNTTKSYTVTINRPMINGTTKLIDLRVLDSVSFSPSFNRDTLVYDVVLLHGAINAGVVATPADPDTTVTIERETNLFADASEYDETATPVKDTRIKITVHHNTLSATVPDTVYYIAWTKDDSKHEYGFWLGPQTFTATKRGYHRFQLWGAQGNSHAVNDDRGGYGGYTAGSLWMEPGDTVYIYVGEHRDGTKVDRYSSLPIPSWNAGSTAGTSSADGGGGGATDIRWFGNGVNPTEMELKWYSEKGLSSRIMVAGGGGGATLYSSSSAPTARGGVGGNLIGGEGDYSKASGYTVYGSNPTGGTQTRGGMPSVYRENAGSVYYGAPGSFGKGGDGAAQSSHGAGGGGGYWGGAGGGHTSGVVYSGAGGSSYISGHLGSVAIAGELNTSPRRSQTTNETCADGTTDITCSYHYSGKIFFNTEMKAGVNRGNGKVIITEPGAYNNYLKSLTSDKGTLTSDFDPLTQNYTVTIGALDTKVTLDAEPMDETSAVVGRGTYDVPAGGHIDVPIAVTDSNGDTRTYTVRVERPEPTEKNSLLKYLRIDEAEIDFKPETLEYDIEIKANILKLTLDYEAFFNSDASYTVTGNDRFTEEEGTVEIKVHVNGVAEDTTYKINYKRVSSTTDVFNKTGSYQKFVAPKDGYYTVEAWGAAGGMGTADIRWREGASGGYTRGRVLLEAGDTLYLYVGGKGGKSGYGYLQTAWGGAGGYNGGGNGVLDSSSGNEDHSDNGGGGGGASDIRWFGKNVVPSDDDLAWDSTKGLSSRVMVAGGGGGFGYNSGGNLANYVGGLNFNNTNGYKFGIGNNGIRANDIGSGGGGGGYWGGNAVNSAAGYGGTSYVSGHYGGSIAINAEGDTAWRKASDGTTTCTAALTATDVLCTVHYSGFAFIDTVMIPGNASMPSPFMDGTVVGNIADGAIRITYDNLDGDNALKSLTVDPGTLQPVFDEDTLNYTVNLSSDQSGTRVDAEAWGINSYITGLGYYEVASGASKEVTVAVTAQDGTVRNYKITINRDGITGHSTLLESVDIAEYPDFKTSFNSNTHSYNLTISAKTYDLVINAKPLDKDGLVTVTIDGNHNLFDNGIIKITVSHDGGTPADEEYFINYNREGSNRTSTYTCKTNPDDNNYYTYDVPYAGTFRIEAWGAEGGKGQISGGTQVGGRGSYTAGTIELDGSETLYLYVGCKGSDAVFTADPPALGGWNGGGAGGGYINHGNSSYGGGAGGGASDISLVAGANVKNDNRYTRDLASYSSRIMVAAGGGGGAQNTHLNEGIDGGGLTKVGQKHYNVNTAYTIQGGNQTSGFAFGYGRNGSLKDANAWRVGGGGGGYWTSYQSLDDTIPGGLEGIGGTSYISGHTGAVAVIGPRSTEARTVNGLACVTGTPNKECSKHYSGKVFTDTVMVDGSGYGWSNVKGSLSKQPTTNGQGTQVAQTGDGFIKITPLVKSENWYLDDIEHTLAGDEIGILTQRDDPSKGFEPEVLDYNLDIDWDVNYVDLKGISRDIGAIITGDGSFDVEVGGTTDATIVTLSPSGHTKTYSVHIRRGEYTGEHTTLVKTLTINNFNANLRPKFSPTLNQANNYEFDLDIATNDYDVYFEYEFFDNKDHLTVTEVGNRHMTASTGVITITIHDEAAPVDDTVYKINYRKVDYINEGFDYTGAYQKFTAPYDGDYFFQAWGASAAYGGGKGAYTSGILPMKKDDTVYIYVGRQGTTATNSKFFNNGTGNSGGYNGGGATDFRWFGQGITPTDVQRDNWDNLIGRSSRIMVAAGAGAAQNGVTAGSGGKLKGLKSTLNNSDPGTQLVAGAPTSTSYGGSEFGIANGGCTGGNGYYPGGGAGCNVGSAGGSSYISGYLGAIAIKGESDVQPRLGSDGEVCTEESATVDIKCSYHYSGQKFRDPVMISGLENMPKKDNSGEQTGNTGHGYARVQLLGDYTEPLFQNPKSRNNYLLDLKSDVGTLSKHGIAPGVEDPEDVFDPLLDEYDLYLTKYEIDFKLTGTLSDEKATVQGLDKIYKIEPGESQRITITVTSEYGDIKYYYVNATREAIQPDDHTTLLKWLEVYNEAEPLDPRFRPHFNYTEDNTQVYEVHLLEGHVDMELVYEPFEEEGTDVTVAIEGTHYLDEEGIVTVTVTHKDDLIPATIYKIKYYRDIKKGPIEDWNKSGYYVFEAPKSAFYKFEGWGARGGGNATYGGKGAYTSGSLFLRKGEKVYVYVGETRDSGTWTGTFNGGGYNIRSDGYPGGGATDFRWFGEHEPTDAELVWNSTLGLNSRIMVAAGGGGGVSWSKWYNGGFGGALTGQAGTNYTTTGNWRCAPGGGTQVSGGSRACNGSGDHWSNSNAGGFGYGGSVSNYSGSNYGGSGGGGGWYGGGSGDDFSNSINSGAGGSSYISGYKGSVAITGENNRTAKCTAANAANDETCSYHYSGKIFRDPVMIAGNGVMPTYDGASTMTGNASSGYASISMDDASRNNYLNVLNVSAFHRVDAVEIEQNHNADLNPQFHAPDYGQTHNQVYYLTLDSEEDALTITARADDDKAKIEGTGRRNIPYGTTEHIIKVTAESSEVREYKLIVTRPASSTNFLFSIELSGLLPSICERDATMFCNLNPENFNRNHLIYDMTVPSGQRDISWSMISGHFYEKIYYKHAQDYDGNHTETEEVEYTEGYSYNINKVRLGPGMNTFTFRVVSETGDEQTYIYRIFRYTLDDNYLDQLVVTSPENTDIHFDYLVTEYSIAVPNSVTDIHLYAVPDLPGVNYWIDFATDDVYSNCTGLGTEADNWLCNRYQVNGEWVGGLTVGENYITVTVEAPNGETRNYTITVYRRANEDTLLKLLNIKNGSTNYTLTPEFTPTRTNYTLTVENNIDSVVMEAQPNASTTFAKSDSVTGNRGAKITRTVPLTVGANQIQIITTAQYGNTETYTVIVNRKKNSNTKLKELSLNNAVPTGFVANGDNDQEFVMNVPPEIRSMNVVAKPSVDTSRVSVSGQNGPFRVGDNYIYITVTAEDGTTKTYTVKIVREGYTSDTLSELYGQYSTDRYDVVKSGTTDPFEPTWDMTDGIYEIDVPYEVNRIELKGTLGGEGATTSGLMEYSLRTGTTVAYVRVTSEVGVTRTYQVNINRAKCSDARLYSLTVTDINGQVITYYPSFDQDHDRYDVTVPNNIDKVVVTGIAIDRQGATVTGNGTYNLDTSDDGNTITVTVTSEDGTATKDYVIVIKREKSGNTFLDILGLREAAISPVYNKNVRAYTARVPYFINNVNLYARTEEPLSVVTWDNANTLNYNSGNRQYTGTIPVVEGDNTVVLSVTAQSGRVDTYTIVITKTERPAGVTDDADIHLKYLSVQDSLGNALPCTPSVADPSAIDPNDQFYECEVEYEFDKVQFGARAAEDRVYVTMPGMSAVQNTTTGAMATSPAGSSMLGLNEGINTFTIHTKAEIQYNPDPALPHIVETFNLEMDYQVQITRKPSDDPRLRENDGIKINNGTITKSMVGAVEYGTTNWVDALDNSDITTTDEYWVTTQDRQLNFDINKRFPGQTVTISGNNTNMMTGDTQEITIHVVSARGLREKTYILHVVKTANRNANLFNLWVEGQTIKQRDNPSAGFNQNVTEYVLTVPETVRSAYVGAEAASSLSTITGTGNYPLAIGENEITVKVEAEDCSDDQSQPGATCTEKEYHIVITRSASNDANLIGLAVLNQQMLPDPFLPNVTEYTVDVAYDVETVTIVATTSSNQARVTGDGIQPVVHGRNRLPVTVTAGDGTTKTYWITVNRDSPVTSLLHNLAVRGYTLDSEFDSHIYRYGVTVDYEVEELPDLKMGNYPSNLPGLLITPMDPKATYEVEGNTNFRVGLNTITITVTASDGSEQSTYRLIVNRQAYSNTFLSSLKVINMNNSEVCTSDGLASCTMTPEFQKQTTAYEVVVPNETTSVRIDAVAENSSNTITGAGLKRNLAVGDNNFVVTVTSRQGVTRRYLINVIRLGSANAYLKSLTWKRTINGTTITRTPTKTGPTTYSMVIPRKVGDFPLDVIVDDDFIAVPQDALATVKKQPSLNLKTSGRNDFWIEVTSNDSTQKITYLVYVYYEDDDETRIMGLTTTVKKDGGPDIEGELFPDFDRNTFEYTVQVRDDMNYASLFPVLINSKQTVTNLAQLTNYPLKDVNSSDPSSYDTRVPIVITAENGATKTYYVTYQKNISVGRKLKDIKVTYDETYCVLNRCNNMTFDPDTYTYHVDVADEVKQATISFTEDNRNQLTKIYKVVDGTRSVIYDGDTRSKYQGSGTGSLENNILIGENTFVVVMKNSLDEETEYTIVIDREMSTDKDLASLKITNPNNNPYTPTFDKDTLEYTTIVPYNITEIGIEAIPVRPLAPTEVTITGANNLIVGSNDVKITVKAHNGDRKRYIMHVIRAPEVDNLLRQLVLNTGEEQTLTPVFNPATQSYSLELTTNMDSIATYAYANDATATVTVHGTNGDTESGVGSVTAFEQLLRLGMNTMTIDVTNGGQTRTYTININRIALKNTLLESLTLHNAVFDGMDFFPTRLSYDVIIGYQYTSIDMTPIPQDRSARVQIVNADNLSVGSNLVQIRVTSSDLTQTRVYNLRVYREGNPSAEIEHILINNQVVDDDMTPAFPQPGQTDYKYVIDYDYTQVDLDAQLESDRAVLSGSGIVSLNEGDNIRQLVVTSEQGISKTYNINIYRKHSSYLSTLTTSYDSLDDFVKTQTDYAFTVPRDQRTLTVVGSPEDPNATVSGNGTYNLRPGINPIRVSVRSVDGDVRDYTIVVTRETSDNNYLSKLITQQGSLNPSFDKTAENYTLDIVDTINALDLDYETEDPEAGSTVIGNNLTDKMEGDVIIRVTSTSGKTRDYTIHVVKHDRSYFSNLLRNLWVTPGTLSPEFDPYKNNYAVNYGYTVDRITISAVRESEDINMTGTGTFNLEIGENTFEVVLTDANNNRNVYTIVATRNAKPDARIKTLVFGGGATLSPGFGSNRYQPYTVTVTNDDDAIPIDELVLFDPNATCSIVLSGSMHNCSDVDSIPIVGETSFSIRVTASDNSVTRSYPFNITRNLSNNANLASLSSNLGTIVPNDPNHPEATEFDKNIVLYTLAIDRNVQSVNLSGTPESVRASVAGLGVVQITSDAQQHNIVVTAENGAKKTYSVLILRGKDGDSTLTDLRAKGQKLIPKFDPAVTHYEVDVPYDLDEIVLEADVAKPTSTVTGIGVKSLAVGENTFEVTVMAENGTKTTYTVVITRPDVNNTEITDLWFEEGELSPAFVSLNKNYNMVVPNEYTNVTEHVTLASSTSTYVKLVNPGTPNEGTLVLGDNVVIIRVTNPAQPEPTDYKVTVNRSVLSYNLLGNLKVTYTDGTELPLTPAYDSETVYYTVPDVAKTVTELVVIAQPTDSSAILGGVNFNMADMTGGTLDPGEQGKGTATIHSGENFMVFKITSANNIVRTIKVRVFREQESNNLLDSLVVAAGVYTPPVAAGLNIISPTFSPSVNEYTVTLENNQSSVTIDAVAQDAGATVVGTGSFTDLPTGLTTKTVAVTNENGITNNYVIKITRKENADLTITNIESSAGTIDSDGKIDANGHWVADSYDVDVPAGTNILSLNFSLLSPTTTVSGNENIILASDSQTATVVATAQNGATRTLTFNITRKIDVNGIELDEYSKNLVITQTYQIVARVLPATANQAVTFTSNDPTIATVDENGVITAVKRGSTTITVASVANPDVKADFTIGVISNRIESDDLDVFHKEDNPTEIEENYVIGSEPETSIGDYLDMFLNEAEYLHIYDKNGNEVTDMTTLSMSYMVIKLEIEGVVYDEVTAVIRGDVDGDGYVTAADASLVLNCFKTVSTPDFLTFRTMDIDMDTYATAADVSLIKSYFKMVIPSLNNFSD